MRWDSLFDDLESQFHGEFAAQFRDEVTQNIRAEQAVETWAERLEKLISHELRLRLGPGLDILGVLGPLGDSYLCFETDQADWLISYRSIRSLSVPSGREQARRCRMGRPKIKFSTLLRSLMRDRSRIQLFDDSGAAIAEGTLSQVGADFLVLLIHPRDEFARASSVTEQTMVPLSAVAWVILPKGF
ncbi:hypothetical protein [Glutamicibacter sp.]|uniref:hypothetical protein n=1 Tax=Glutamicibacter sp. TaxID=1931995 RepID=UPI0028BE715E|nr:hypothetical protein [Glutamicibacter sp.]